MVGVGGIRGGACLDLGDGVECVDALLEAHEALEDLRLLTSLSEVDHAPVRFQPKQTAHVE